MKKLYLLCAALVGAFTSNVFAADPPSLSVWFDTPTKQVPAIKYTLTLESKDGVKIGEWTEVVHQADGDRSWW